MANPATSILAGKGREPKRDYVISQYYGKQTWVRSHFDPFERPSGNTISILIGRRALPDLENDPEEIVNLSQNRKYAQSKID